MTEEMTEKGLGMTEKKPLEMTEKCLGMTEK